MNEAAGGARPAVMIIGWRNYLLQSARNLGLRSIAVLGPGERDWSEPDLTLADDSVFVDDPEDSGLVLAALQRRDILTLNGLLGVCPATEAYVATASILANLLGAHALPLPVALAFRDKMIQKRAILDVGIPAVRPEVIENIDDVCFAGYAPQGATFPAVLKPISGSSTSHVRLLPRPEDLVPACLELRRESSRRTYVLEPFVDGEEWEMDGIVLDGEVTFISVGAYQRPCINITTGAVQNIVVFDPQADSWAYEIAHPFAQKAINALSMTDGVFHLEAFIEPGRRQLVFGECGARVGGSIIREMVHEKFGVDLGAAHLMLSCRKRPSLTPVSRPGYIGKTNIPNKPGILISHPSEEEIENLPGVLCATIQAPRGMRLEPSSANVNVRLGLALVEGGSIQQVRERMAHVVAWCQERTVTDELAPDSGQPPWKLRQAHATRAAS